MTDTAKRLGGPTLLTTSAADQYTVPGSTTGIIRSIHCQNGSSSAVAFTMSIGTDADGTRLFDAVSIPGNNFLHIPCFIVLAAAEKIQAKAASADNLVLTLSGVEVS